jgi:hypothetical protein
LEKDNETPLIIIGVRIPEDRREEHPSPEYLKSLIPCLSSENLICTGEFQCWPRTLSEVMGENFRVFTPWIQGFIWDTNEFSFVTKNKNKYGMYEKIPYDHIVTSKNMLLKTIKESTECPDELSELPTYDWNFVSYQSGYKFQNNRLQFTDDKSHLFGLPDHAILRATISF